MTLTSKSLSVLLAGTAVAGILAPLRAQSNTSPAIAAGEATDPDSSPSTEEITVTGTRIRGATVSSDVVSLDREAIVEAGQVDLGEAIRSLPQNFAGGQNPGVASGAGLVNSNINSASSANLRGLGPDATLTLLNGHRLPYNSAFQGVDISAIPLAAVERIEVVPDGASALYGSDAVGGVVNVILRRDFEGVATSAQVGASTSGGNFRQQADIVGGAVWGGGGVILAYDFANNSAIRAKQRSYAASLGPDTTLYPSMQRHALTLSAHHEFTPGVEASIDTLYSRRQSFSQSSTPTLRITRDPELEGFALAPSLRVELGARWEAKIIGVFGRDRTDFRSRFFPQSGVPSVATGRYRNEVFSLEAGVEGPVLTLPGGDVRLAVGGGVRNNRLDYVLQDTALAAFDVTRRARFGYAELYLPLVSERNARPGIDQLSVSAAVRYEGYAGLDEEATPRIGVTYSPVAGLALRGSWSRSFKAPTLYQQYVFYETILLPAAAFGAGSGADAILFAAGGNPEIASERARSWTAGVEYQPPGTPGLLLSATWYDIEYEDRVVSPIAGPLSTAFSNPGYASLIDFDPDAARLDALIAGAQFGLQNFSGRPYDPGTVVALIDNRNINVAAWAIEGLDARLAWDKALSADRSVGFDVAASWLESSQQVTPALPEVQLAGTIFNPAQFRLRGTARYQTGALRGHVAVNYVGKLVDRRFEDEQRLSPTATIDLGVTYAIVGAAKGREPGLEISLSVQNLLNDEPERIGQTGPTDAPYDSTNYSPIGRFLAFGIRRHW